MVVGRDPQAVLDRTEAEEAQATSQPAALQATILGNRVPEHGPRPLVVTGMTQREDATIALAEQAVGARSQTVVDQPARAQALDQSAADQAVQSDTGRAWREPELAEQDDQATGPDSVAERAHIGAEHGDHQLLGLQLL